MIKYYLGFALLIGATVFGGYIGYTANGVVGIFEGAGFVIYLVGLVGGLCANRLH